MDTWTMNLWNKTEERILKKMEGLGFPGSVKTTVIWATREAENSAEALKEVEALLDEKPTGREMTRAVQKFFGNSQAE